MFKKKLLTFAAATLCAAFVIAEPTSLVKKTTAELIEDGAIDSFAFGNEEGKGIVYGKYDSQENRVELGWGNAIADKLWLSVYDAYFLYGTETKTESLTKVYGTADGVNVDYVDENPRQVSTDTSSLHFDNKLGVGLAFNNKFGVQAYWRANWYNYKNPNRIMNDGTMGSVTTLSNESKNSATGNSSSQNYDNVKNYDRANTIKFNFKGAGIENVGNIAFYAKLNNVRADLNFNVKSNDYTQVVATNGTKSTDISSTGINSVTDINPGLEIETGFNLPAWGVAKPQLSFVEDFSMAFKLRKYNTSRSTYSDFETSKTTTTVDYDVTQGGGINWTNVLTPRLTVDFDLGEKLTLKTRASAAISLNQSKAESDTYTRTTTSTTYDKATGNSTVAKTTVTAASANPSVGTANRNMSSFKTTVTPKIDLGLVYQTIPGKMNINFGATVNPGAYTWTTTEYTNANINTVSVTENTNAYGTSDKTTTVNVNNDSYTGTAETRTTTFNNAGTTTALNLGATWFFTDAVKLDVYYSTAFNDIFTAANKFGIECCVLF